MRRQWIYTNKIHALVIISTKIMLQLLINPEYRVVPIKKSLKQHHVRNPKYSLYMCFNDRPFKSLLNYQHGRVWGSFFGD